MTHYQRSAQLWPLLVFAAKQQKILSYKSIEKMTGLPKQAVGKHLGPIQKYCKKKDLPPLTAIVVNESTGLPGDGFNGAEDVIAGQARCFVFDWYSKPVPTVEEFEGKKSSKSDLNVEEQIA